MDEPAAPGMIMHRMMMARPRTTSPTYSIGGDGLSPVAWSYQNDFDHESFVGQISLLFAKPAPSGRAGCLHSFLGDFWPSW